MKIGIITNDRQAISMNEERNGPLHVWNAFPCNKPALHDVHLGDPGKNSQITVWKSDKINPQQMRSVQI